MILKIGGGYFPSQFSFFKFCAPVCTLVGNKSFLFSKSRFLLLAAAWLCSAGECLCRSTLGRAGDLHSLVVHSQPLYVAGQWQCSSSPTSGKEFCIRNGRQHLTQIPCAPWVLPDLTIPEGYARVCPLAASDLAASGFAVQCIRDMLKGVLVHDISLLFFQDLHLAGKEFVIYLRDVSRAIFEPRLTVCSLPYNVVVS